MNDLSREDLVVTQRHMWEEKLARHGATTQALGSESLSHKQLRYQMISQLFNEESDFSLLDVGAGVGDYYGYLQTKFKHLGIRYRGVDITPEFCELARSKYPGIEIGSENILSEDVGTFDYVTLSGLFHQRGTASIAYWTSFMVEMLSHAFRIANKGIAFNVLTNLAEFKREDNYYVDIFELQKSMARELSRFYRVACDGPLFEATMYIYKPDAILKRFPDPVFQRYVLKENS